MEKVKILVACHKPGKVYQDEVYTPIHVGRAISNYKDEMADMIGDDTGDNISDKNPMYCELTAQYWAWKNLPDVDYIGFCHYRRYFYMDCNQQTVENLLRHHDVITLKYYYDHPMWREMVHFISVEDLTILMMVIKQKYPEYEKTMLDYLYGNVFYPKNMLICKKEFFDQYAEWLFDVLMTCEKYIKPSPYTRGRRTLAYMGEYLLTIYLLHHQCRVKTVGWGGFVGLHHKDSWRTKLIHRYWSVNQKILNRLQRRPKSFEAFYLPEVLVGFQQDGLIISEESR